MTYEFVRRAQKQRDLQDVVSYLEKPLRVLEEITSKLEHTNHIELRHRCERIVNRFLPDLIDNYCSFSFEYRNRETVNVVDGKDYTAKEMLLLNIAKIIEEIRVLEKEFNDANKFALLVNHGVVASLGHEPGMALQNKFNIENGPIHELVTHNEVAQTAEDGTVTQNSFFVEIAALFAIMMIVIVMTYDPHKKGIRGISEELRQKSTLYTIVQVAAQKKDIYTMTHCCELDKTSSLTELREPKVVSTSIGRVLTAETFTEVHPDDRLKITLQDVNIDDCKFLTENLHQYGPVALININGVENKLCAGQNKMELTYKNYEG